MQRFDLNQGLLEEITLKEKPTQRSDRPNFDDKFGDDDEDDAGFIIPADLSKVSNRSRDGSLIQFEDGEPPILGDDEIIPMEEDQPELVEEAEAKSPQDMSTPLDLEPIEPPAKKARREMLPDSSKVSVDPVTELTGDQIRRQLSDYSDLIEIRPLAPPTRHYAAMQETGLADRLVSEPLIQFGSDLAAFLMDAQKTKVKVSRKRDDTTLDLEEPPEDITPGPRRGHEEEESMHHVDDDILPPEDDIPPEQFFNPVDDDMVDEAPQESHEISEESGHRRLSRATGHLLTVIEQRLKSEDSVSFLKLTRGLNRQQAAIKFYSVVALIVEGKVVAEQAKPFADISIQLA